MLLFSELAIATQEDTKQCVDSDGTHERNNSTEQEDLVSLRKSFFECGFTENFADKHSKEICETGRPSHLEI